MSPKTPMAGMPGMPGQPQQPAQPQGPAYNLKTVYVEVSKKDPTKAELVLDGNVDSEGRVIAAAVKTINDNLKLQVNC